ncbi:MAG: Dockerin type domain, partial [Planctomycetota bacterium]
DNGGGGGGGGNEPNPDLNNDGVVNGVDLATLLTNWNVPGAVGDIDGDGQINGADLAILLSGWTG